MKVGEPKLMIDTYMKNNINMESSETIRNLDIEKDESILKFYFNFTLKDDKLEISHFREE